MKRALLFVFLGFPALAQPAANPAGRASVSGSVTTPAGAPLRRASVYLSGVPRNSAQSYSAETDSQGNFSFAEVSPGRYTLFAERRGYLPARYSNARGSILELEAGESKTGIALKLPAQGIIGGRVVDEEGEPMPDASVTIYPLIRGQRAAVSSNTVVTNADGDFVIGNLPPGRFILSATAPLSNTFPGGGREPIQQTAQSAYVPIYYPDVPSFADATPIDLAMGAQARGIEIRLHKIAVFRVSGKVVNSLTHGPGTATSLNLIPNAGGPAPGLSARTTAVNDGGFRFDDVAPGNYILQATPDGTQDPPLVGRQLVEVGSGDLDSVVLELKPALRITGRVTIEGNPPAAWPRVALLPEEGINYQSEFAEVDPDGSFSLSGLEPAPYRAVVNGLSLPYFIKSIRYAGHDVMNEPFDVSAAGSLDIIPAPPGAHRILAALGLPPGFDFRLDEDARTAFDLGEGVALAVDIALLTPDQVQISFR